MVAQYVEVCPTGGVNVQAGRVVVGPCEPTVSINYRLNGVTPVRTESPIDGRAFFVPRVNTFRNDGQLLYFFNTEGSYSQQMRVFPCVENLSTYGVDVFSWANQNVQITSRPEVPIVTSSEQGGSQTKYQLRFNGSAVVDVVIGNADNGRDVTFVVDVSAEILAGRFRADLSEVDMVELRGPFNDWSGGAAYRMYPIGTWRYTNGVFVSGGKFQTTVQFIGDEGSTINYKFYVKSASGGVSALRPSGWESGADRSFILGPPYVAQGVDAGAFRN